MDLSLSADEAALKASVERYCANNFDRGIASDKQVLDWSDARQHWDAFAELGWLGVLAPTEFGGVGGGLVETSIILQELGRATVTQPYLPCAVVALAALLQLARSDARDELIREIVAGKSIAILAHGHASADSGVAMSARGIADGDYMLNGRNPFVLSGNCADFYLVSAQRYDACASCEDLGLFMVKSHAPGVARRTFDTLDGRGAVELTFHDVRVARESLLGAAAVASAALRAASEHGIVGVCAESLGAMEHIVQVTVAHLKARKAYGTTLSTFQALQHRLADMLTELELSRSMFYRLLATFSEKDENTRERNLSATKALVGRSVKHVAAAGVQLHGGMGMVADYVIGKHFKQATMLDALFGNSDYHWDNCARLADELRGQPELAAAASAQETSESGLSREASSA